MNKVSNKVSNKISLEKMRLSSCNLSPRLYLWSKKNFSYMDTKTGSEKAGNTEARSNCTPRGFKTQSGLVNFRSEPNSQN